MAGTNKRYYRGKAKEWTMSEASTGKPMLVVLFDVLTEGADVNALTWRGFFTEATMDRTIEAMRYMGFEGDDLSDITGLDRLEVDLVVEDEEYTDEATGEVKTSAKVQWVNKPRALSVKTVLEGDKLKSFAAEMKAAFRKVDAAAGKRTPAPAAKRAPPTGPQGAEPPPLSDADIPF
jgi:hypothetical protein